MHDPTPQLTATLSTPLPLAMTSVENGGPKVMF